MREKRYAMKRLPILLVVPLASIAGALSLGAIAACGSGPSLTAGGSDVALVNTTNNTCFGCGYIAGFSIGSSGAYLVYSGQSGGPSSHVDSVDFANGVDHQSQWAPGSKSSSTTPAFDITSSSDHMLFWTDSLFIDTGPTDGGMGQINEPRLEFFSTTEDALLTSTAQKFVPQNTLLPNLPADGGPTKDQSGQFYLAGFAADPNAVYVAYASGNGSGGGNPQTPDSQSFTGGQPASTGQNPAGAVARIDRTDPNATPVVITGFNFLPQSAIHILAQNAGSVFFPDVGASNNPQNRIRILAEEKASFGSPPVEIASFPQDNSEGSLAGWTIVGIAASATTVAWSAAPLVSDGGGNGGSNAACRIYAIVNGAPVQVLFGQTVDGTLGDCSGLAIDDTYAYVALTSTFNNNNGTANGLNGAGNGAAIVGSGIARVPLAGGSPQIAPLQSQKWYGPRRVFVDDTYVYAIDPTYVARFSKSDFR